jgi:hypothetical protein
MSAARIISAKLIKIETRAARNRFEKEQESQRERAGETHGAISARAHPFLDFYKAAR